MLILALFVNPYYLDMLSFDFRNKCYNKQIDSLHIAELH